MATVKTLERKYVLSVCLGKHQIKTIQILFRLRLLFFSVNLVVELSNSDVIEKEVTALTTGSTVYP